MKRSPLRWPLREGLFPAVLAATILAVGACTVEVEDPEPYDEDHLAEADDMLHAPPSHDVAAPVDEGRQTVDELEDFGADEREQEMLTSPAITVSEPEPDPWDDPMSGSNQSSPNSPGKD